jgi:hypothetical protein
MDTIHVVSPAFPMTAVAGAVANLTESRTQLVKGIGKIGALIQGYAGALCQAFNLVDNQGEVTTPWFELKGKLKAGVKGERANFANDMTQAGYAKTTIDVYWQRVKEASGYVTAGNRVSAGSTDVDAKTLAELKTMINRIFKAEEEGKTCEASEIKGILIDAYTSLGGDADNLG